MRLSFGDCVLDTDTRELRRAGVRVDLTPKAYDLLELLVRARPKAVSKREIHDRLWPSTFIADVTLTTLAFEVRRAIGDDARRPRHLRTVRKYGYAFAEEEGAEAAPAAEPLAAPGQECLLVTDDREFLLDEGEHVIGRGHEADIVLDLPKVSRRHARIRVSAGEAVLEDLGSKNGTQVGGRRVEDTVTLRDRDEIQIGAVRLVFRAGARESPTETDR